MQTVGQKLKTARETKQLSLEKVFEATRIRVVYLQALEADDLSSLPSPVQARGYLRNYAEYLELNIDELTEEMHTSQKATGEIIGPADLSVEEPDHTLAPDTVKQDTPPSESTIDPVQEIESQSEPAQVREQPSGSVEESALQPETVIEETIGATLEESTQSDISENLWQTWLNRLSSIISTPGSRKPESQMDDAFERVESSDESDSQPVEPEAEPEAASQPETLRHSDGIFKEIGAELRHRRETLSLHLEEVERNTHVKAHYLDALEQGAMDKLPSTVQTRGMLSNYASFLDMDVDAVLLRFADALQARHRERNPQRAIRKPGSPIIPNIPPVRSFIAGDMVFGIGMAVLLIGFAIWGINRVMTLQSQNEVQPTAPSISDILLASPDPSSFTATPTLLPVESFSNEATPTILIPTVNVNVNVQINLVAVERTYMRVTVDDEVVFEGRVVPGNAYPFEAENQVEVLVGSGAAIRVLYNGRDLGLMGGFGQVVNNIYLVDEIITPTALPSPTPTTTLTPTPTLRPTNTPVPSRTPIPSRTPSQ